MVIMKNTEGIVGTAINAALRANLVTREILACAVVYFAPQLHCLDWTGGIAKEMITGGVTLTVDMVKNEVPHLLKLRSRNVNGFVHYPPAQEGRAWWLSEPSLVAIEPQGGDHALVIRVPAPKRSERIRPVSVIKSGILFLKLLCREPLIFWHLRNVLSTYITGVKLLRLELKWAKATLPPIFLSTFNGIFIEHFLEFIQEILQMGVCPV